MLKVGITAVGKLYYSRSDELSLRFSNVKSGASVTTKSTYQHACVPACLRTSVVYVPTCQKRANFSFLRASVPIIVPTCQMACRFFSLVCQRAKRRANFSKISLTKCEEEISILCYYMKKSKDHM